MRIPEVVWEMAVRSAVECGLSKAASVLGLDYYMLRRRVAAASEHSNRCGEQASPTLVELPRATLAGVPECMIKFEGKHGGKMRILVAIEATDFRGGIDGLARVCKEQLKADPFSGWVFVFRNLRATAIKVLTYDGRGFWLAQRRLSTGRLRFWPGSATEEAHLANRAY